MLLSIRMLIFLAEKGIKCQDRFLTLTRDQVATDQGKSSYFSFVLQSSDGGRGYAGSRGGEMERRGTGELA